MGHAEGRPRFSCPSFGLRVDAGWDGGVESGGTGAGGVAKGEENKHKAVNPYAYYNCSKW